MVKKRNEDFADPTGCTAETSILNQASIVDLNWRLTNLLTGWNISQHDFISEICDIEKKKKYQNKWVTCTE